MSAYYSYPRPHGEPIEPQGFGGWMIPIVLIVGLGFIFFIIDLAVNFKAYYKIYYGAFLIITNIDLWHQKPTYMMLFILFMIIFVSLLIIGVTWQFVLLITKNRLFPTVTIILTCLSLGFWSLYMVFSAIEGEPQDPIYEIILSYIVGITLIFYLRRSKRVKNTFINSWD